MVAVDPNRLRPRIQHVRDRLRRLRQIRMRGKASFLEDVMLQDAAIRNLQTSVEALLDMANHIVSREGLGTPTSYREAVDLLMEHGVLPRKKGDAFSAMVRFRNRAVHLYDEIDADEIYGILENDLDDFEVFIEAIVKGYFAEE